MTGWASLWVRASAGCQSRQSIRGMRASTERRPHPRMRASVGKLDCTQSSHAFSQVPANICRARCGGRVCALECLWQSSINKSLGSSESAPHGDIPRTGHPSPSVPPTRQLIVTIGRTNRPAADFRPQISGPKPSQPRLHRTVQKIDRTDATQAPRSSRERAQDQNWRITSHLRWRRWWWSPPTEASIGV
jgi:hypothetical protein